MTKLKIFFLLAFFIIMINANLFGDKPLSKYSINDDFYLAYDFHVIDDFDGNGTSDLFIIFETDRDKYESEEDLICEPLYLLYMVEKDNWVLKDECKDNNVIVRFSEFYSKSTNIYTYNIDTEKGKELLLGVLYSGSAWGVKVLKIKENAIKICGDFYNYGGIKDFSDKKGNKYLIQYGWSTDFRTSDYINGSNNRYWFYYMNKDWKLAGPYSIKASEELYDYYYNLYDTGFKKAKDMENMIDLFWFLYANSKGDLNNKWIDTYSHRISKEKLPVKDKNIMIEVLKKRLELSGDTAFQDYLTHMEPEIFELVVSYLFYDYRDSPILDMTDPEFFFDDFY